MNTGKKLVVFIITNILIINIFISILKFGSGLNSGFFYDIIRIIILYSLIYMLYNGFRYIKNILIFLMFLIIISGIFSIPKASSMDLLTPIFTTYIIFFYSINICILLFSRSVNNFLDHQQTKYL